MRDIPSAPEKILDAPGLKDDYYINIIGKLLFLNLIIIFLSWPFALGVLCHV